MSRVRDWVAAVGEEIASPADTATLRSMLLTAADDSVFGAILDEFFDHETVAVAVNEVFLERGAAWPFALREQLARALLFHGLDKVANAVVASLETAE